MSALLEQAFAKASELPDEQQDLLAHWLLAELEAEDAFDRKIAATAHTLTKLAEEAMAEHRAGLTQPMAGDAP